MDTSFHVIENHPICHMYDRPHDDPTGCPTCHAENRRDWKRCIYFVAIDDKAKVESLAVVCECGLDGEPLT